MNKTKKHKFVCTFVAILLSVIFFTACNSNVTGHQIVGIWEHEGNRIEFTDKGYFKKGSEKYTYFVDEKQVTIDNNGEAMVIEYSVNPNGTLTMNGIIYYPVSK